METRRAFIGMACLLLGVLLFSACQKDELLEDISWQTEDNQIWLSMNLPETDDIVVTRAEATELEKNIYTVRLLAFDSNQNCFYNKEVYNGYDTKTPYQASQALGLMKQTGAEYTSCTIWVIANAGVWEGASSFDFETVKTLSDLENAYGYRLLQGSQLSQRDCLAMTGKAEGVNMTQPTSIDNPVSISMERVMARVTFTIDVPNGNLEFYFNEWSVESLPRYSYVLPHDADWADDNTSPAGYDLYYPTNNTETQLVRYDIGEWLSDMEPKTYGFYTYENRRGNRSASPNPDNLQGEAGDYAEDIKGLTDNSNSPKFKTLYAPDDASFITLSGLIREKDTQNVTSFAYKIALGANNTNDYNLLRNHNYIYNIHINGVHYDDITVDAFDSRVHKGYALQITAPYCESVDAHYDKRYLNILASAGKVDLQLYPTQADAEAGTNPLTSDSWIVLSEKDTYNIDIDPDESTGKSFSYADVDSKTLYIYTDENVSTQSRSAVLKVTHTPAPESSEIVNDPVIRYYTYTQAGFIEVNGVYVESYEEYGMNLTVDPDVHAVAGLQWGWHGTLIGVYDSDTGFDNTQTIIGTDGNPGNFEESSLYNDYAARYCYYKNKRNELGQVIENNWYLPAINELMPLTSAVTATSAIWSPETMIDKTYWSSSVPTRNEVETNPFQSWYDNATWDKIIARIVYVAWELLFRDWVENPNGDYYYTKVAKAAENGEEAMDNRGESEGYDLSTYYRRLETHNVRAVRKAPQNP